MVTAHSTSNDKACEPAKAEEESAPQSQVNVHVDPCGVACHEENRLSLIERWVQSSTRRSRHSSQRLSFTHRGARAQRSV